ncbi:MAG: Import inner membrane translocase subunit Tim44 [Candidatus Tokpelaia sp. JSC189]|nr:MAG: Import inner membrane translocase subunit Tim44 [Candidatus Tokpelaia sp. JSC189]
MDLNIVTLIFFVLAVIVFIQLRNVLGRRTGNERPPFDPYARPTRAGSESDDNIVILPPRECPPTNDFSDIDSLAPSDSVLNNGLRAIRKADSTFSPMAFCNGAKAAYEIIMTAFASGNREMLKKLLVKDVYEEFIRAIDEREANSQSVRFSLIAINKAEITDAGMQKNEAYVTMRFSSEVISATYDKDEKLIDGNPQVIVTIRDRWTFARDVHADNPNWKLVATEDDE